MSLHGLDALVEPFAKGQSVGDCPLWELSFAQTIKIKIKHILISMQVKLMF